MARPERFELPTARFVAEYSIQLSYGRLIELPIVADFFVLVKLFFELPPIKSNRRVRQE